MKIILIKTAQQEITLQEDEVSVRNIFDEINTSVAHYSNQSLEVLNVYFPEIDEILKRHPNFNLLVKQYWQNLIEDNRAYLYRFVYPVNLKNNTDIKNIVQKQIIEIYQDGSETLVDKMLKYDETDKIFAEDNKRLADAFFDYVTIHPENCKKHKPKALMELPDNIIRDTAIDGFFKKLTISNRTSAIDSYKKLPPELKTDLTNPMVKFLVDLIFREPYLYESDCPEDFINNEKILSARKTGWINLLNQKSPLLYAGLPENLKQDKDFLKYREPAKKNLIEKLTHPKKETDPSIQKYIDMLTDEFRDEDFMVSLYWEQKNKI
jgi:hypothetical protein